MINSQFPDCSVPEGAELTLFRMLPRRTGESYRVPDFSGTRWFCYAVWNVNSAGERSALVYGRLIRVAYQDAFDVFIVEVREAPHTHAFREWMDLT